MPLPRTVTVCGVRCALRWRSMADRNPLGEARAGYIGAPDRHTNVVVNVDMRGNWRGEWYLYRARGTRGALSVSTHGVYTDPRRCAEALSRLVHGWDVAVYSARVR